jgi:hypothetical protein
LSTGAKSGYTFVLAGGAPDASGVVQSYVINADPTKQDTTGIRHFFSNQSAVIRQAVGAAATAASTPIGN